MSAPDSPTQILLVEPQFVLRRTIVAVARDLALADLQEAASVDVALLKLAANRFDGIVIAVDCGPAALDLIARLRQGGFASLASIPVIALTPGVNESLDASLEPLRLLATLRKPFKVAELLHAMHKMTTLRATAS